MIRTGRYHYIANLEADRAFPLPRDLEHSPTWDAVRELTDARVGGRTVDEYLHRPAEELYDVVRDPGQAVNLAGAPEHSEALRDLREQLARWRAEIDVPER
jgi:N-sulfoglucosamine sulfohydrolase